MATVEEKEIGIPLGVDEGEYYNTEYSNGALHLKKEGETSTGEALYVREGYWISEVIDTVGKFKDYDKIAVTKIQFTKDYYKIETRTSDNGINFDGYVALTAGGNIMSVMKRYIQVKITLYAGLIEDTVVISNFNNMTDVGEWDSSEYVETDGVLKLKRDYLFKMNRDNSWTNDGYLLRKKIVRSEWKKIDRLEVE